MGVKNDESFLRYLTMGACGTRSVIRQLQDAGFQPIELERYSTANKIWATKIKRLRLPDLLCVRTGLRVEVRAKSDLAIKLSDTPTNPARVWHAGLRDDDLVAFVACLRSAAGAMTCANANYFRVSALRAAVGTSKLGPPKSAAEGAERDRLWPSLVPTRDGSVTAVIGASDKHPTGALVVQLSDTGKPPRKHTYPLGGRNPYVAVGDSFDAGATIIAGTPFERATLSDYVGNSYNPLAYLASDDAIDRYVAVKALPHRPELALEAIPALVARLEIEPDSRVKVEVAASLAALGRTEGEVALRALTEDNFPVEFVMECVLILTELRSGFGLQRLRELASDASRPSEIRQAAVWGLGVQGHRRYDLLVPFLRDGDESVAIHAIAAFGADTPTEVVDALVSELDEADSALASKASEAIRQVAPEVAVTALVGAIDTATHRRWAIATLGRIDATRVREALHGTELLHVIEPLLTIHSDLNWFSKRDRSNALSFVIAQRA